MQLLRFNSRIRKRALLPWMPKDPHGCGSALSSLGAQASSAVFSLRPGLGQTG